MSCVSPVVVYRIVYMILFLYFIVTFHVFYSFWRASLYYFHSIVVVYSMICLILIYIFQFEYIQDYFQNDLKISELVLRSIGFEKLRKDELALRLLIPTTFLIVVVIQIHYFNDSWLKLSELKAAIPQPANSPEMTELSTENIVRISRNSTNGDEQAKRKEEFLQFVIRMIRKITDLYRLVVIYTWRLALIHIYKVVIAAIGCYCLMQVSLFNLVFFFLVLFGLLVDGEGRVRSVFSGLFLVWVCMTTLASMVYQLKFIESPLVTNCSNTSTIDPYLEKNNDNLMYVGLYKSSDIIKELQVNRVFFNISDIYVLVKRKKS